MLEFSDKVVAQIQVEIPLTENDIESIIVGGFEGGINYWGRVDNTTILWVDKPKDKPVSTWATKLILDGKTVKMYDVEDESEIWDLTLDKLIEGFALNYNERPFDNNLENGDATTYDCIIQYALFGEIVYG